MSSTRVEEERVAHAEVREGVAIHDAAVAAAVSNPRRRHGKAKATALHQPLVSFHRLPKYLRDNEYVVGKTLATRWYM